MTVLLHGIEDGLCEVVAAGFRFQDPYLKDIALVVKRHLFSKNMPETEAIQRNLLPGQAFDHQREPVTGFFTIPGAGTGSESSASYGGKHRFLVEVMTRLPKPGNDVGKYAAQLAAWMEENLDDVQAGDFLLKGVKVQGIPGDLVREADGMMFASTRILVLCVPTT